MIQAAILPSTALIAGCSGEHIILMIVHSAYTRLSASVAALLAAVTLSPLMGLGPAFANDPAAQREVMAANQRLQGRSYRMRMTAPDQTVLAEHVAPDSLRMITSITGQPGKIETITVGGETRSRVIGPGVPGTWICSAAGPQPPIALTMNDLARGWRRPGVRTP